MARDFVVLARIEEIRPDLFFVMVSGVPSGLYTAESASLKTGTAHSFKQAESLRERLVRETCDEIKARGDRVMELDPEV